MLHPVCEDVIGKKWRERVIEGSRGSMLDPARCAPAQNFACAMTAVGGDDGKTLPPRYSRPGQTPRSAVGRQKSYYDHNQGFRFANALKLAADLCDSTSFRTS